jgi:GDP-L-fucose synthase
MQPSDRVYVAGHSGLLGSAIVRRLRDLGYTNLQLRFRKDLELTDSVAVQTFFEKEHPQHVFLAAAKVGGILANSSFPADFIRENLAIQSNVIEQAWRNGVERLFFAGSSCIYPRVAPQPLRESSLLAGPLEITNRPYAIAKIAGIEMCWALNRQYGTKFVAGMFTNLYGPGDNYHATTSHLIPALICKMHEAKISGSSKVEIWGTGTPRREFLYSDDAAAAAIFLMNLPTAKFDELLKLPDEPPLINIGWGTDLTIREVAEMIAQIVGFTGELVLDPSKPDGTPRKLLDTGRLNSLGWRAGVELREGLQRAYRDFCLNHAETPSTVAAGE